MKIKEGGIVSGVDTITFKVKSFDAHRNLIPPYLLAGDKYPYVLSLFEPKP